MELTVSQVTLLVSPQNITNNSTNNPDQNVNLKKTKYTTYGQNTFSRNMISVKIKYGNMVIQHQHQHPKSATKKNEDPLGTPRFKIITVRENYIQAYRPNLVLNS